MAPEAALIEVNEAVQCCPAVLSAPLDVAQAAELARAFSALGDAGPVHGDRRGKWVWYSLDRARLAALRAALDA